jgi:hypothetical protein
MIGFSMILNSFHHVLISTQLDFLQCFAAIIYLFFQYRFHSYYSTHFYSFQVTSSFFLSAGLFFLNFLSFSWPYLTETTYHQLDFFEIEISPIFFNTNLDCSVVMWCLQMPYESFLLKGCFCPNNYFYSHMYLLFSQAHLFHLIIIFIFDTAECGDAN